METREELAEVEQQIRNRGSYPAVVSPDELQQLSEEEGEVDRRFSTEMISSLDRWLDMADAKLRGGEIRACSTAATTTSSRSTTSSSPRRA